MNRRILAASVLSGAIGLALAAPTIPAQAQGMSAKMQEKLHEMLKMHPGASKAVIEKNMKRVAAHHLQRCYGVNAAYKNDCASGVHSCAGSASQARDPKSFVLLPAGDCAKLAGGHLKPA